MPVEAAWLDDAGALLGGIRERFVAAHRQLYGHGDADAPLEVVAARVRAVGLVATPRWPEWTATERGAPRTERAVCFRTHGTVATPVFDREVAGPATSGSRAR